MMKLKLKPKLILGICCLISCCLVFEIDAHCLRKLPRTAESSSIRHIWQPRYPVGSLADTSGCNRPTTLDPTADSNVATLQLNDTATTDSQTLQTDQTATPVVTLANYVYQCAAKREPSPSKPSTSCNSNGIDLAMSIAEALGQEQQMPATLPAVVLQLADSWDLE